MSPTVGTSGSAALRFAVVTPSALQLAGPHELDRARQVVEQRVHLAGHQVRIDAGRALVGHVQDVEPRHHLEQLARHVHRRAVAGRRERHLARIGFDVRDELSHRFHREVRRHHHDVGELHGAGDRRGVAHVIERQVLVERLADRVVRRDEHDGVAVRRRLDHRLRRQHAALAGAILDHAGRAEMRRQEFAEDAGHDVVRPAGEEPDHELDRAVREFFLGGSRLDDGGRGERAADHSKQQGKTDHAHLLLLESASYARLRAARIEFVEIEPLAARFFCGLGVILSENRFPLFRITP